jgi:hypothetical protein
MKRHISNLQSGLLTMQLAHNFNFFLKSKKCAYNINNKKLRVKS